ncbi:porin [uncultured Prochlorococcus sp.]|uniref:porin n=1 Tax=uncultured Prochlorococcus sp. TaxID=159733 RepID=UPI002584FA17|nr:porin [uncultured Prochlorococcus sp.]
MKLFKSLLVAPAALGLLAPMAATANEVNFKAISNYSTENSEIDINNFKTTPQKNLLLSGGEGLVDSVDSASFDGGFSSTTTMDGKAVFDLGFIDYSETDSATEDVNFAYSYTLNLNTNFTGDDNLYVRIKTGNHKGWMVDSNDGGYLSSGKDSSDALKIDKIWYKFPVGERNTVWVGPKIENYYMHATAPSIYKPITKQFTLGGNGNAYGASTDTGAGWAYKADNGFAISSNVGSKSKTTTSGTDTGILTNESKTSWATQIGITKPQYSASVIVNQKYNGWTDGYYHTASADDALVTGGNHTAVGLRGWWRPEDSGTPTPSVSLGYDTTSYDGVSSGTDSSEAWFVGLTWQDMFTADDRIGLAFGQPTMHDDETNDPFAYELYYSYKANDSVTITPTVFGGNDRDGGTEDVFGALLQTTFKF